jgi:hypothetical protein
MGNIDPIVVGRMDLMGVPNNVKIIAGRQKLVGISLLQLEEIQVSVNCIGKEPGCRVMGQGYLQKGEKVKNSFG